MPETSPEKLTVAVVGATGAVGRTMIKVLTEKQFPYTELRLLASARSAGTTMTVAGRDITVELATPEAFEGIDIAHLLGRRRDLQGAGARGGEARLRGRGQLQRLADGPGRAARGVPGQPGRPRLARGDHRQPQLLDDAAHAAAHGAA